MLTSLSIEQFALVEQLQLSFQRGLTSITGETGAGKSIIIDALQYALGARADASVVRQGATQASITANFDLQATPAAAQWLAAHGVEAQGDCQLQRIITAEGRSKQFINQRAFKQSHVRELAELLISIHGQHENQSLLRTDAQLQFLDDFTRSCYHSHNAQSTEPAPLNHSDLLDKVAYYYDQWASLNQEIEQLASEVANPARVELLRYQLQELDELNLMPREVDELTSEHKLLSTSDDQIANCQQALDFIYHTDHHNAFGLLTTAMATIGSNKQMDKRVESAYNMLNDAMIHTQEAADSLRDYIEQIEANPQRLQDIDERLSQIHTLARKHRINAPQLHDLQEQLRDELDKLSHRESRLTILHDECLHMEKAYYSTAQQLRKSREDAIQLLNNIVSKYMQRLGMTEGLFQVKLTKQAAMGRCGIDKAEFLVCTNPGQPFKPLNKVASGGELSRISLAIQVITTKTENLPCMIFDEVDVGVGGRLAEIIGEFLADLAERTQVLCITHLPQVAAQGLHHLQVNKTAQDGQTQVNITPLLGEQRVEEIARMLGGVNITEQTLAHAREMLQSNTTV